LNCFDSILRFAPLAVARALFYSGLPSKKMNASSPAHVRNKSDRCDWCNCATALDKMVYCLRCKSRFYCSDVCASGEWGQGEHCRSCSVPAAAAPSPPKKK
jgi:uncharacterized paraquat-inducible protein A